MSIPYTLKIVLKIHVFVKSFKIVDTYDRIQEVQKTHSGFIFKKYNIILLQVIEV
jgi:hypothetical protein